MKLLISLLAAVAIVFAACGGGQQTANCIDNTKPDEPRAIDPHYCQSSNNGGGLTGSGAGDFFLYYWMFSSLSRPMAYGTVMTPAVVNHYHLTQTAPKSGNYKTATGEKITASKGSTKPAPPKAPSQPKIGPAPSKPSAPKPSAPKPSAPKSGGGGGGFRGGGGGRR